MRDSTLFGKVESRCKGVGREGGHSYLGLWRYDLSFMEDCPAPDGEQYPPSWISYTALAQKSLNVTRASHILCRATSDCLKRNKKTTRRSCLSLWKWRILELAVFLLVQLLFPGHWELSCKDGNNATHGFDAFGGRFPDQPWSIMGDKRQEVLSLIRDRLRNCCL